MPEPDDDQFVEVTVRLGRAFAETALLHPEEYAPSLNGIVLNAVYQAIRDKPLLPR